MSLTPETRKALEEMSKGAHFEPMQLPSRFAVIARALLEMNGADNAKREPRTVHCPHCEFFVEVEGPGQAAIWDASEAISRHIAEAHP